MRGRVFRRWTAAVLALFLSVGLAGIFGPEQAAAQQAAVVPPVPSAAGQFYATRGRVAKALKIAGGVTATVDVTGVAGVPASGVASVALNIAVKGDTNANQLIVYPSGAAEPANTSAVRYRTGIYLQNLLTSKVGADGNVKIINKGNAGVILYADVHGYTLTAAGATAGSTLVPLKPARIAHQLSVPANGTATLSVLGQGGIPTTGVSHAVFTINTNSSTAGKLTVYPSGTALPVETNLDYGLGLVMQNHVYAKLGTDGKVIISNAGTKAAAVDVHVAGYFASPQAAVAGSTVQALQPDRLVNRVSIAAQGIHTFAPLGAGGVPASGVSGVSVNITAQGTQSGNLRVFPSGTAGTPTHVVAYHPNNQFYSATMTAKLGADGKISILNDGPVAPFVWVDVFGYFKTPTGCSPGAGPAEPAHGAAVLDPEPYSPTAVFQASPLNPGFLGSLELAYGDNAGKLFHGHIQDPGTLNSVQWTAINEGDGFTGQPGLNEEADGRLHVVAQNLSSDVWTRSQTTRTPAVWGPWTHVVQGMGSHAAVARQDDTLVSFSVGTSGRLRALPQYGPNQPGDTWFDLGLGGLSTSTTPVLVPVSGGLRVFVLDTAGTWRTAVYARGILSGCASLAGSGFTKQPAVVSSPGFRLRIFARAADGHIMTMKQDSAGAWPQTWDQVGDLIAAGSPSALLSPGTSRIEVLARGTDGVIYSTGETGQATGVWRPWKDTRDVEQGDTFISATDPTAFEYLTTSGPAWAFLARDADNRTRFYPVDETAVAARSAAPTFKVHTLPAPPR